MKRFLSGVVAASFVATVGLAAQQNPPGGGDPGAPGGQKPAPAPSAQATSQSKTVTLSGCIQNAPGTSSATAGGGAAGGAASAQASSSAGAKFVLANAKMSGGGAAGGAVGTTGSTSRYELSGDDKTITPHVNHQVEITGTIESSASAGAAGAKASGPTLKVESVKMVSATCS